MQTLVEIRILVARAVLQVRPHRGTADWTNVAVLAILMVGAAQLAIDMVVPNAGIVDGQIAELALHGRQLVVNR